MYDFIYYEALTGLLRDSDRYVPVDVNRSTVHRWRASGSVPAAVFYMLYYYARFVLDSADDVDAALSAAGFDISSLPHALLK